MIATPNYVVVSWQKLLVLTPKKDWLAGMIWRWEKTGRSWKCHARKWVKWFGWGGSPVQNKTQNNISQPSDYALQQRKSSRERRLQPQPSDHYMPHSSVFLLRSVSFWNPQVWVILRSTLFDSLSNRHIFIFDSNWFWRGIDDLWHAVQLSVA